MHCPCHAFVARFVARIIKIRSKFPIKIAMYHVLRVGGLNILPQKRWNVYGRENRFKVAQDEEKAAAEQHELERKRRDAESSFRRQKLLADARQRQGVRGVEHGVGGRHGQIGSISCLSCHLWAIKSRLGFSLPM